MADTATPVASSAAIEHLRWSLTSEVGPILFSRIVERFGSAQQALGAGVQQLQTVEGIGRSIAEAMTRSRDEVDVEREIGIAAQRGVRILCRDDDAYPAPLRHIPDPPICLYVRGTLEPADTVAMAIVGARKCSLYGREQARRFAYVLASRGMTIVSGLARGIDGEAHKGAISAGGRTFAVLGNGLGSIYPPEHQELADRIAENGALLSELPMTAGPQAKNFLPRNRLIAGLSLGVLVIEAGHRSGSLTTARLASEYNREVFALPGRVDSEHSAGTNALIRDQSGKLVTRAEDVIEELGEVGEALGGAAADPTGNGRPQPARVNLGDDERAVFGQLDREERSIESLAEGTGLPTSKIAAALITLQLKGLARQLPGNLFVRTG